MIAINPSHDPINATWQDSLLLLEALIRWSVTLVCQYNIVWLSDSLKRDIFLNIDNDLTNVIDCYLVSDLTMSIAVCTENVASCGVMSAGFELAITNLIDQELSEYIFSLGLSKA